MSVCECMGNGIILLEKDDDTFEVKLTIDPDIKNSFNVELIRVKVNDILHVRKDTQAAVFTLWSNGQVLFVPCNSIWTREDACIICEIVKDVYFALRDDIRAKKREVEINKAFAKCHDRRKKEQIAKILGV